MVHVTTYDFFQGGLSMPVQKVCLLFILFFFVMLSASQSILAQSTAFSYQGKLLDGGNPADGNYDLQFKLFDTVTVGTGAQQGSTVTVSNVTVSNGSFSVSLDFGAIAFPGADRYLEIAVRPANTGSYTTLTPRQPITSTPYAIKSQNAATAEGLSATASANFIQNGTSQQTATDFNISGNGTAGGTLTGNTINAVTQYNLNGLRVFTVNGPYNDPFTILSASNIFVGEGAGVNTTPDPSPTSILGKLNSFFGNGAGQANTTGNINAFFGTLAGNSNTTGERNSFFGIVAGRDNTTGSHNSFFGNAAGASNTTGSDNAFFGTQAGVNNTGAGASNAFFGSAAGFSNTTGSQNAFFGGGAGFNSATGAGNTFIGLGADFNASNSTGISNTLLGYRTHVNSGLSNATAIGAQATVTQSNSLVLGGITGINNGTSVNVGIGTTAPAAKLHINGAQEVIRLQGSAIGSANTAYINFVDSAGTVTGYVGDGSSGDSSISIGSNQGNVQLYSLAGPVLTATPAGNVGIGTTSPSAALDVVGGAQPIRWARAGAGKTWAWEVDASATYIKNATDGTYPFSILNGGNVGIGTTAPGARLHVAGNTYFGGNSIVIGSVGIGTTTPAFKLDVSGEFRANIVRVDNYVSGGTVQVCVETSTNRLGICNSSLRYKTAVKPFAAGLAIINRLQPISYRWKQSGLPDIGLAAEEVEKVEPLLTFRNNKGEVDGVKYNQLSAVFINAFKEQQAQISQQQGEIAALRQELRQVKQQKDLIRQQQQEMAAIKKLLCAAHPKANICKATSLK
jgi:hypothetical protein